MKTETNRYIILILLNFIVLLVSCTKENIDQNSLNFNYKIVLLDANRTEQGYQTATDSAKITLVNGNKTKFFYSDSSRTVIIDNLTETFAMITVDYPGFYKVSYHINFDLNNLNSTAITYIQMIRTDLAYSSILKLKGIRISNTVTNENVSIPVANPFFIELTHEQLKQLLTHTGNGIISAIAYHGTRLTGESNTNGDVFYNAAATPDGLTYRISANDFEAEQFTEWGIQLKSYKLQPDTIILQSAKSTIQTCIFK